MTILQSILLGIVQGLTEFLPVSSSGHLVLVPYLLGWEIPADDAFVFDVLVQVATLFAVIAYFWRDLLRIAAAMLRGISRRQIFAEQDARLGWYLILATIPAGLTGLTIKDAVEAAFNSPIATALFLWGTSALLLVAEKAGRRNRSTESINWLDALLMGAFQALALFPGISRSGATITGGMLRNLDRPSAARFSFMMSIPIMLAAGILATLDLIEMPNVQALLPTFLAGFVSAAVVGYLSIRWLLNYLAYRSLKFFAGYTFAFGLLALIVSIWRA